MTSTVPRAAIGDDGYRISRLIIGGWQLSDGHRSDAVDEAALFADLRRMVQAGMTTFDVADIYTGVEERMGRFRAQYGRDLEAEGCPIQIHTKYVPDRSALSTLKKEDVQHSIDRSLHRLQADRIDLVQFHWWDYQVPGYVETALALAELQRAGKIRHLGATNFDVPRMREMLDAGVPLVSHQVQYSLLDTRPEHGMTRFAEERGFGLLCYGALAGGFLTDRHRGKAFTPDLITNRSLTKYHLIIEDGGGWESFQRVLDALARVARRHGVPLSAVALRFVLDRPNVGGAMVGTFHGRHLEATLAACELTLTEGDVAELQGAMAQRRPLPGDTFELEREPGGRHAVIMRTDLHQGSAPPGK